MTHRKEFVHREETTTPASAIETDHSSVDRPIKGVSFDLFGTLVVPDPPDDPAGAVAAELADRDVPVPDDWASSYVETHVDVVPGQELSLSSHVEAALSSRSITADETVIRNAVLAAFDGPVRTRDGAEAAVGAAARAGPVGICSNCSVAGLVERTLSAAELDESVFDVVVTSVGCGWRKPDRRAFEAITRELGIDPGGLLHVGDDPKTDDWGRIGAGSSLLIGEDSRAGTHSIADRLEAILWE